MIKYERSRKITQAYLRLNGFFTLPHFTILEDQPSHVDFLAVRLPGSQEIVNNEPLLQDKDFLSKLGNFSRDTIGLVVEVTGGVRDEVNDRKFEYTKPFLGILLQRRLCLQTYQIGKFNKETIN
jgi:hypothetical protein